MPYLAAFLLLVASPAFALPQSVLAPLADMAVNAASVAGLAFVAYVGIAAIKMMLLNFVPEEEISEVDSLLEFKALPDSGTDWAKMSTKIDFYAEARGPDGVLPDIDPARLVDYDDIDFIVAQDMAELDAMNKE